MTTKRNYSWLWVVLLFDVLSVASFVGFQPMGGIVLALFGLEATVLYYWERPKVIVPKDLKVSTENVVFSKRLNLTALRDQVGEWSRHNFGPASEMGYVALLGAFEELGELAHAHIKQLQGIRGAAAQHEEDARDAIADAIIYLADYCSTRDFDFQEIVESTWAQVRQRDWVKYPETGFPIRAIDQDPADAEQIPAEGASAA
jgi:NTP pyrophosphatase (non-canonical NTP hydrolase)